MSLYGLKVRALKTPLGLDLWRRWQRFRGRTLGSYHRLPSLVTAHASGRSFADVGCMWGVDGEYAFRAAEAGATRVLGIDVFGPTPEFLDKQRARGAQVEFVLGDVSDPATAERVGVVDVVLCAGVLYHHPSPYDLLVALRRICGQTLILRTSTIPEIGGMPNGAVFYPWLSERDRRRWNLSPLGVGRQVGISDPFDPQEGYGNWFWGLTPSSLDALLRTAGFVPESWELEPFACTVICRAQTAPCLHDRPDADGARRLGEEISAAGEARPT